ncbi:hypothetical protein NN3_39290 [Nocardia neocaledoniensis NBRC 108232]|uniref:TetR family transcriptional regulator n=1 Tax=Nocardia neocaledoniensis TaxID=236511 RepID=A0A317NG23_9NOCA|nr:TetR/AcrR family transcriptional regulator [Nocardia neocaledoniensis]PWV74336.1 TetR family transcriptional regulator [Nocardia neocaledoniensis]GEM32922.1 hypothetical protein NN3_39290 [Nocardia neocaledoniensis NBRC 108232]
MARVVSAAGRYGGRSAAERRAERRARFREAGLETFGAGAGYRNTRLVDLCRAAGLSTRQFYQEYDTLEDLLSELHLHIDGIVEKHVLDEVARVDDLPLAGRAAAMVRAYLSYITRDPRCARITFVEVAGISERIDAQRRQRRSRWIDMLCALLESFAARGELPSREFRLTAATFLGAVDGLMRDWCAGWIEASIDQLTDELLGMLLGRLGAADAPATPVATDAVPPVRRRPPNRRATILRAATDAFAEHGYHRTSMADIAAVLDITSGALYRHFRTKQELLGCCLREGLDLVLDRVDSACDGDAASDAALRALVRVSLEQRGLARLWQLEFRNLTPADRIAVLARSVRLTHRIGAAVQARYSGVGAADRDALGWLVLSVVTSPSNHRTRLPHDTFATVLDAAVDAVIGTGVIHGDAAGDCSPESREADTDLNSELRTEQLIAAAAQLFSERGFAAVSIEEIGTSVGVRGPAVYHHFESKSDLLDEIIDRNNEWIQRYTERALAEGGDPRESLRLVLRYYVHFAMDRPDLVGTAVGEARYLPDDAAARYRRIHREGIIGWARLLQSVRPELSMPTARVLIHTVTTMVNEAVRNPRLTRRPALVSELCSLGERIALAELPELRVSN